MFIQNQQKYVNHTSFKVTFSSLIVHLALISLGPQITHLDIFVFHQYHYIQSHLSGLVLDIPGGNRDNGVKVIMYPRKENSPPSDNQLWQLEYQPDGTFLIISKMHGKALDCGGQEKGTNLLMWDRHGRENQRWRMDGNYLVSSNGLVADVENNGTAPGTPVILWTSKKHHSENQLFDIIDV